MLVQYKYTLKIIILLHLFFFPILFLALALYLSLSRRMNMSGGSKTSVGSKIFIHIFLNECEKFAILQVRAHISIYFVRCRVFFLLVINLQVHRRAECCLFVFSFLFCLLIHTNFQMRLCQCQCSVQHTISVLIFASIRTHSYCESIRSIIRIRRMRERVVLRI